MIDQLYNSKEKEDNINLMIVSECGKPSTILHVGVTASVTCNRSSRSSRENSVGMPSSDRPRNADSIEITIGAAGHDSDLA